MIRLAVLGSTRGTLMLPIIEAIKQGRLSAEIALVISNKADAYILENAKKHDLRSIFIESKGIDRTTYDDKITEALNPYNIDLVVLIGFMRILSTNFVTTWKNKIINIHPSLLPAFAGKMDRHVHQAVLNARENESGCTVHYVTEEVDGGPIVLQKKCMVYENDTVDTLRSRVQALEADALIEAIINIGNS